MTPEEIVHQVRDFHDRWGATHVDDIDQLALWEELGRLLSQRLSPPAPPSPPPTPPAGDKR